MKLARRLLRWALPLDVRESIVGDLDETFVRDSNAIGTAAARRNYRRKSRSLILRFLFERVRDRVRAIARFRMSLLDFRLGARMLVRYPVLTLVGSIALTFAIAIGASVFAFISLLLWPSLPLPEGDRVVSVRLYDHVQSQWVDQVSADFLRWRHLASLADVGAGRALRRNLTTPDGLLEQVSMAEVTASTFDLVKTAPIMGRALTDADAHPAAPAVMVIGQSLWRTRFAADPEVIGRVVTLGEKPTTVIGVMPEGLKFPATQEAWLPLRLDETAIKPREGMELRVWARLKPGVPRARAAAELEALGAQASADWPATHTGVRPEVNPFAGVGSDMRIGVAGQLLVASVNVAVGVLILLISSNVALLMFARAATRDAEIIVRSALGASRGRIITQFFAEALMLCGVALVLGLALARSGIRWGVEVFTLAANGGEPLPFWFTPTLPPISIAYAVGLAVLAAVVTGVLPAMKVTRGLGSRLRETTAGGGGVQFSGVWTVVIVAQIALTVAFPAVTYFIKRDGLQIQNTDIGVPPSQYLSAWLTRDRDSTQARFEAAVRELRDGLAAVPGVSRVTLADKLPLMWHGTFLADVDAGGAAPKEEDLSEYRISIAAVDPEFFATFDAQPLAGRVLALSDYAGTPRVAVVNESFVKRVLGGRNPIGRRVRYTDIETERETRSPLAEREWLEIVGLVRDMGMATEPDPKVAGIYIPLHLSASPNVHIGARVSGDFAAATAAVRRLGANADVTLRVTYVQSLDRVPAMALAEIDFWTNLMASVSVSALMLSLTGIYAVMSFAVSKRTREIGIRMALGSDRGRVVLAVLRRPLLQVSGGIVAGAILTMALSGQIVSELGPMLVIVGYSVVMLFVCLLASLIPVRRALRVNPTDALRTE